MAEAVETTEATETTETTEKLLGRYALTFDRSRRDGLSLRLAVYEKINLFENSSTVGCQLEYKNTGEAFTENVAFERSANGSTKTWTRHLTFAATTAWTNLDSLTVKQSAECSIPHSADGTGTFDISFSVKTDAITIISTPYYRTTAAVTATGALSPIDQTVPQVTRLSVTADRYGGNASLSLAAAHSVYKIKTAVLELRGLTYEQARNRSFSYTADGRAVRSLYQGSTAGSTDYGSRYTVTVNAQTIDAVIPLYYTENNPLDSGGRYPFNLTVTAENGKTTTLGGTLAVAQKVTGIVLSDDNLTLAVGDAAEIEYSVLPADAEVKGVTFASSDGDIARVSTDGTITAASEGTCIITVTSEDKGSSGTQIFSAALTVTVALDTDGFPNLTATDYLGVVEITRIATACTWLAERLGKTSELTEVVCTGRAHDVTDIRTIFEAIERNCAVLADTEERTIPRQNNNWYELVNGWITTLNGLYASVET